MRTPAVLAVLLVTALAGFLLTYLESPNPPPAEQADNPPSVARTAKDSGSGAVSPKATSPGAELAVVEESTEDCTQVYLGQMRRLEQEILTEEFADQVVEEARSSWADSANPELKVFAAQLLDDYGRGVELFVDAMEQPTTSPYFLWSAVNMCLADREYSPCPIEDWLERLLTVDSENSLVWIRAAGYYHSTGDLERAKAALDQATIAYEANDYWFENIMNAKAGIDAVGGFSERVSYLLAIEVALVYPSPRALYETMCEEMSAKDSAWSASCVAYGQHVAGIATRSKVRRNAKAIQATSLIASGEPEDSERIQALREAPTHPRSDALHRYPDSITIYISTLESSGEIAAVDRLRAENERRRRDGIKPECGDITRN